MRHLWTNFLLLECKKRKYSSACPEQEAVCFEMKLDSGFRGAVFGNSLNGRTVNQSTEWRTQKQMEDEVCEEKLLRMQSLMETCVHGSQPPSYRHHGQLACVAD
jgi:hypothetical protein